MAYKRRSVKRSFKKKTFKRKSYAPKAKATRRVIKKMIQREVETKTRTFANLGLNLPSVVNPAFTPIAVGCQAGAFEIVQGTGEGSRVGNRIKVVSAKIAGTIIPLPYNATSNSAPIPSQVKMFLFYDKTAPNTIPNPYTTADFIDVNNSVQGFHNDLVDMWAPVNTDKYHVFMTKIYKVGYADMNSTATGTTGQNNFTNNDFKVNCNFNIDYTKYMHKTQTFQDNSMNATNRQVYMMWVPVAANGAAYGAVTIPCGVQFQATLKYKDA